MILGRVKKNIITLTFASLIIRLAEFCFGLYLSRIYGAKGMGLLSLAAPVISFFLSFMTQGLIVTVSKSSAGLAQTGRCREMERGLRISLRAAFLWSIFLCTLLFLSANTIACRFFGQPKLAEILVSVCPLMVLMSFSNILKGHFLGLEKIVIPSLINITEKLLRFPLLGLLLSLFPTLFGIPPVGLVYLCYGLGELFSVFSLLVYHRKIGDSFVRAEKITRQDRLQFLFPLIKQAAPLCLTECVLELSRILSSLLLQSQLQTAGYSSAAALTLIGKCNGMVLPLLTLPMVCITSVSAIIIPKLSALLRRKKFAGAVRLIRRVLFLSLLIGTASGILLSRLSPLLGTLLYHQTGLTGMLKAGAICLPLFFTASASNSLLIAIGNENASFTHNLLHQLLLLICLLLFVRIPTLNIYGYFIALFISHTVLLVQNLYALKLHKLNCISSRN